MEKGDKVRIVQFGDLMDERLSVGDVGEIAEDPGDDYYGVHFYIDGELVDELVSEDEIEKINRGDSDSELRFDVGDVALYRKNKVEIIKLRPVFDYDYQVRELDTGKTKNVYDWNLAEVDGGDSDSTDEEQSETTEAPRSDGGSSPPASTGNSPVQSLNYEGAETLYISGPMNGKEDLNREAFYELEERLLKHGYAVINPARLDDEKGELDTWHDYLHRDMEIILERDAAIVLFGDWHNSRGATNEAYFANCAGLPIYEWDPETETLQEDVELPAPFQAKEIVLGARRYDYGHSLENFKRIAELWSATLEQEITVQDVALMMIQMKIAREQNSHNHDNLVDIIGYTYALSNAIDEHEHRGGDASDLAPTSDRHKAYLDNHVNGAENTSKT